MEPDVGWWASAAATPDLRTVTVGRRTRRTTDRLNGWPVSYVQLRLNVRYRRTSATTNDWTSDDDWDDRTSSEWTSDVGRLNLTRLTVRRRTVDGFDRWRLVEWTSDETTSVHEQNSVSRSTELLSRCRNVDFSFYVCTWQRLTKKWLDFTVRASHTTIDVMGHSSRRQVRRQRLRTASKARRSAKIDLK